MSHADIYTRPADIDADTLANLGPLRALAGVWRGVGGVDLNPGPEGARTSPFEETVELQPIDPQTNGPQLFYGLRYHSHMTKPGEIGTYHGQLGYWLWEPATGLIIHSFTIPRGQVVLAEGRAAADATTFEVKATRGTTRDGICSTGFLEAAFRTDEFHMTVTANPDGGWSYFQDTVMQIRDRAEPFHHTDRNTLSLVSPPTPNPLARGAR
ncbi:FABP family protein [Phenylobacterium sp.]|jgi:hypothetical protein|uniref:FABP family protein n=1 Tax=Phenylobacterium sp. TaxID=1871053 RepID=UPI002F40F793